MVALPVPCLVGDIERGLKHRMDLVVKRLAEYFVMPQLVVHRKRVI
jgi:hypothetical protein